MRLGLMAIWVKWFLVMGISSAAQMYSSQSGKVLISGKYQSTSVAAVSHHLHMQVSYDKAEIHMHLAIPTIITDIDSLNLLLQKLAGREVHFTGKMNINHVQTKSHPKQKIVTNGTLTIDGISKAFSFTSVLEHFPIGSVSCNLSAEFVINLNEFGISTQNGENKINIRLNQLILKKPGEQ